MNCPLWTDSPKITDVQTYSSSDFNTEREMCNYIEAHAPQFARDLLEIDYLGHRREFQLGTQKKYRGGCAPRVDFLFVSKSGQAILVECKNPKNSYAELVNSIGQMMAYICIAESNRLPVSKCAIVASKYDHRVGMMIKEFSLPIDFYILTKNSMLKLAS